MEEESPVQKLAGESGQVSCDEVTRLPLDPKLVADATKEELMFMRRLQVYQEVLLSYLDKSGLKAGTRWVYTNKGDASNPFIRARLVAQETKSERVDTRRREQHVCSYTSTEKPQGHCQSMHDWQATSTC